MSASQQLLLGGKQESGPANYIEDVFQTWLYTGNGSTQTITNGIDLAGKGGLVWIKNRTSADGHRWFNTVVGSNNWLSSSTTSGNTFETNALTSFNANGFTLGSSSTANFNTDQYASWTFRKQPKFFDVVTYTGDGMGSVQSVAHNLGAVPGCMLVKSTSTSGDWYIYHRSTGNNQVLNFNTDAAYSTTYWNNTTPTSTSFTVTSAANQPGQTYVAYLFAHNAGGFGLTGADNVISCGSFVAESGTGNFTVNLGYEPQWILYKRSDSTSNWTIVDNMRGMPVTSSGVQKLLNPNTSSAETDGSTMVPTATGFQQSGGGGFIGNATYIYIAIRRGPMKTPTTGTSVFNPNTTSGSTGATVTTNFPVDLQITRNGARSATTSNIAVDRLRGVSTTTTDGGVFLGTTSTNAESSAVAFTRAWDNTGFQVTAQNSGVAQIYWNFRRAPGFLDEVCYTGTGVARTVAHNLTVVPELMIVKSRSAAGYWPVYSAAIGNDYILSLDTTGAKDGPGAPQWNSTTPTASVFSLGASSGANASGVTFVAYLFASCPGVSKVGSYTGTGTTQQINCGFTAGARFVLIKRTDSTGDWYVWDSARGIVAGNDPYLLLNSTAAEVTNTDYVDTYSAGFEISSTAPAAINASGGTFIFLAIA